MSKRAFISIEDKIVKAYIGDPRILKEENFYELDLESLNEFLKKHEVKDLIISQFTDSLISLRFDVPFGRKIQKKKKLLDGIIKGEIRKRYPSLNNFSYSYNFYESAAGAYFRCYLLDESFLNSLNNLIFQGIDIIAFYPSFIPLRELIKNKYESEKSYLICQFSQNNRYIFLFDGDELIFQRKYESSGSPLDEEDMININMTVSYSIQNLRIAPERVFFIGIERKEIEGLKIHYEFIDLPDNFNQYATLFSLIKFEKSLRGKEFFLLEYKKYLSTKKYLNLFSLILLSFIFLIIIYNFSIIYEIFNLKKSFSSIRSEIAQNKASFLNLQAEIDFFEKNLKPIIQLRNKQNLETDIRLSLYQISEASKDEQIEINSIDIENKMPQKVKVEGIIMGRNFTERQKIFLHFKDKLHEGGLKITRENWEIIKGEFSIEGEYESQRFLQQKN